MELERLGYLLLVFYAYVLSSVKWISVHLCYELKPFAGNEDVRRFIVSKPVSQYINTGKKSVETALNKHFNYLV